MRQSLIVLVINYIESELQKWVDQDPEVPGIESQDLAVIDIEEADLQEQGAHGLQEEGTALDRQEDHHVDIDHHHGEMKSTVDVMGGMDEEMNSSPTKLLTMPKH